MRGRDFSGVVSEGFLGQTPSQKAMHTQGVRGPAPHARAPHTGAPHTGAPMARGRGDSPLLRAGIAKECRRDRFGKCLPELPEELKLTQPGQRGGIPGAYFPSGYRQSQQTAARTGGGGTKGPASGGQQTVMRTGGSATSVVKQSAMDFRPDRTLTVQSQKPGQAYGIMGPKGELPVFTMSEHGHGAASQAAIAAAVAAGHHAIHGLAGFGDPGDMMSRPARMRMGRRPTPADGMQPMASRAQAARLRYGASITSPQLFGLDGAMGNGIEAISEGFAGPGDVPGSPTIQADTVPPFPGYGGRGSGHEPFSRGGHSTVSAQPRLPPMSPNVRYAQTTRGYQGPPHAAFQDRPLFGYGLGVDLVATLEGLLAGGPVEAVVEHTIFHQKRHGFLHGLGSMGLGDVHAEMEVKKDLQKTRTALVMSEKESKKLLAQVMKLDRQILALRAPLDAAARSGDKNKVFAVMVKVEKLDAARSIAAARAIRYAKAGSAAALLARNMNLQLKLALAYREALDKDDKAGAETAKKAYLVALGQNRKIRRLRKKATKKWAANTAKERARAANVLKDDLSAKAAQASNEASQLKEQAAAQGAPAPAQAEALEQKSDELEQEARKLADQSAEESAKADVLEQQADAADDEGKDSEEEAADDSSRESGEEPVADTGGEGEMSGFELAAAHASVKGGLSYAALGELEFFDSIVGAFKSLGETVGGAIFDVTKLATNIGCSVINNPAMKAAAQQNPKANLYSGAASSACGAAQGLLRGNVGQALRSGGAQLVQQGVQQGSQLVQQRLGPGAQQQVRVAQDVASQFGLRLPFSGRDSA